jgi:hypothetical protein
MDEQTLEEDRYFLLSNMYYLYKYFMWLVVKKITSYYFFRLFNHRNRFYEVFYSVFDDQSAAMNSILKGKELFTQQVSSCGLALSFGIHCSKFTRLLSVIRVTWRELSFDPWISNLLIQNFSDFHSNNTSALKVSSKDKSSNDATY